jgi:hypothetical protein
MKKVTLANIRDLREEFQVSMTATLIKLVRSNLFPIVIVCHGPQQRRWFKRANIVPGWWFPRADLAPESFAFDMMFQNANESTFPRKIGADAWFEFRGASRFEILEQSFRLPNNELLTLLTIPDAG